MSNVAWAISVGLGVLGILQLVFLFVSWWRTVYYQLPVLSSPLSAFVHLVVPCKGDGKNIKRHLKAFASQDYQSLLVSFVTESKSDTVVLIITDLVAQYDHVRHVVAGLSDSGS